ncbi:MAG: hypothetical protein J6T54_04305 [Fibrobacter sp.]|nr:hypothetical protein [Fibrobacter sp.]
MNDGKQICNPSVSQDPENYPAAMLWLNFGGKLNVEAPDSVYTTSKVVQHDRLSVSDTSGKVLWYLMRDTEAGDCQFQDPEWSTHPNFIVALRAYDTKGSKSCENLDYGLFAVRMSDKKQFFFYDKDMSEFATPHLWVNPDAVRDSSADDSKVEGFFGTKDVRLVYVNKKDQIVFVDYANGGAKKSFTLKKPSGVDGWMMDSPMISPDGKYVVYNVINAAMTGWRSFIQELSKDATPFEIEKKSDMISEPVQPHWFTFADRLFVVWTEFPQGSQYVNKNDLSDASVQNGSAGRTMMREIKLAANAPADLAFEWVDNAKEIAPVPMIGGRSPDGYFLATGANNGYLLKLP